MTKTFACPITKSGKWSDISEAIWLMAGSIWIPKTTMFLSLQYNILSSSLLSMASKQPWWFPIHLFLKSYVFSRFYFRKKTPKPTQNNRIWGFLNELNLLKATADLSLSLSQKHTNFFPKEKSVSTDCDKMYNLIGVLLILLLYV
jgi:hypothetical protein